jgi:hypothetical protein
MTLAAFWLLAIISIAAIAVEVSRLTDTATEVQVAADAAALAAAQNVVKTNDQTAATSAGQAIAAKNTTDGRAPGSTDTNVGLEFGSYTVAGGFSLAAPVPGISIPAVRSTVTIANVRYLLASVFGVATSTTVVKRAVATYTCTGQSHPTAPITICDCTLQTYLQGQPCNGTGGNVPLTQSPDGSQNSCFLSNPSSDADWFPTDCPSVGLGLAPLLSAGQNISLNNGQVTPILRDFASCVGDGVHNFTIPVIHCSNSPSCSIGNCNHTGQVVGFATINIASTSDIQSNGSPKYIRFTQVCDSDAPGTGGAGSATCFGQGNVTLVDAR